jgi:hypothetical protein
VNAVETPDTEGSYRYQFHSLPEYASLREKMSEKKSEMWRHFRTWTRSLTPEENYALAFYHASGGIHLNRHLRFNDWEDANSKVVSWLQGTSRLLDQAIEKGRAPHHMTLYRVIYEDLPEQLGALDNSLGQTIVDPGYMSTTWTPDAFKNMDWPDPWLMMRLKVPEGFPMGYLSGLSSNLLAEQYELLLPRNTRGVVTGYTSKGPVLDGKSIPLVDFDVLWPAFTKPLGRSAAEHIQAAEQLAEWLNKNGTGQTIPENLTVEMMYPMDEEGENLFSQSNNHWRARDELVTSPFGRMSGMGSEDATRREEDWYPQDKIQRDERPEDETHALLRIHLPAGAFATYSPLDGSISLPIGTVLRLRPGTDDTTYPGQIVQYDLDAIGLKQKGNPFRSYVQGATSRHFSSRSPTIAELPMGPGD